MKKEYITPEWEIELFTIKNEILTISAAEGGGQGGGDDNIELAEF